MNPLNFWHTFTIQNSFWWVTSTIQSIDNLLIDLTKKKLWVIRLTFFLSKQYFSQSFFLTNNHCIQLRSASFDGSCTPPLHAAEQCVQPRSPNENNKLVLISKLLVKWFSKGEEDFQIIFRHCRDLNRMSPERQPWNSHTYFLFF